MEMIPKVLQAVAGQNFQVYLYFHDGTVRLLDASPLVHKGGVFAQGVAAAGEELVKLVHNHQNPGHLLPQGPVLLNLVHVVFLEEVGPYLLLPLQGGQDVAAELPLALDGHHLEGRQDEVGVNLKLGYNGDLTSKQAGSVGGQMVKKIIKSYEESMK